LIDQRGAGCCRPTEERIGLVVPGASLGAAAAACTCC